MASELKRDVTHKQLAALAELGGRTFKPDEQIVFEGNKLILPVGSSLDSIIALLVDFRDQQKATVSFARQFKYRPWDVAYNGVEALREFFGMVSQRGMFMSPPALIDIPVGVDEVVSVPTGQFQIPQLPRVVFTFDSVYDEELGILGTINAKGPKEEAFEIQGVFNLIEDYLKDHSIYKGKAIDGQERPNFIDVLNLDESQIVYAKEVQAALDANLYEPLRRRGLTKAQGLPR